MGKIIKRIMKYAKKYYFMIAVSVMLSLLLALTNAAPALLIKYGIDSLVEKKTDVLIYTISAIMLLGVVKGMLAYLSEITREKVGNRIIFDIRKNIYGHLQMMSLSFYNRNEIGQLMARFTNDAVKVQGMITNFFSLFSSFGTIIILLSYVIKINWKLAIGSFFIIPFIGFVIKKFSKRISTTGKDVQEKIGSLNSFLEEIFLGIKVIKAFGTENYEIGRFEGENKKNFEATMKNVKVKARVSPIIEMFNSFAISGLFLMGGFAVIKGSMTAGDLMSFITSIALLYTPLRNITGINNEMQTSRHSAERIFEILDEELEIVDDKDAVALENINGKVKFKNVDFRYTKEGNHIIKNVNISADSGQSIALVGRSGSGKTTLVSLLSRFYDINDGTIEIDGVELKKIKLESLRKHVGIVPQESFIFRGTIYDNICYGSENVSEEMVIEAARKANVLEFAEKMADGIYSNVGERGGKLSGGQKQRIAIARALIKNPKILILDEATSALDTESERLVQEAIERLMKGRTTFVIAHRLSTIINADKIVVMDEGEVKEEGTHKELLEKDGIYKQLYNMQFGKENE